MADRESNELLLTRGLPEVSNLSLEDKTVQAPKRHGRGTFLYKKIELYSNWQYDKSVVEDAEDDDSHLNSKTKTDLRHSKYGTCHVLVLAYFLLSTRMIDREKLFETSEHRVINDTTALAVFRTPAIAPEACIHIQFPFTVRILEEDNFLLGSISPRDLEAPSQRQETSARTAQRLIAQGMGLKLPSTFGSKELKNQEEARKNRIRMR